MRSRLGVIAAALAIVLLAASCSPGGNDSDTAERTSDRRTAAEAETKLPPNAESNDLRWTGCRDQTASAAGLQCASLRVPLDPAEPDGEKIELALTRSRATGSAKERIGSI